MLNLFHPLVVLFLKENVGNFFFGTKTIHEEGGPRGGWQKTILFLGKKKGIGKKLVLEKSLRFGLEKVSIVKKYH